MFALFLKCTECIQSCQQFANLIVNLPVCCLLFFRCVAGDEALEKQKKENAELIRKVENAQAAMMELTQENQSLQVR